jgi:hypothetical protein
MHGERDIVMDTIPPSSGERARANLGDFDIPGACESSTALHVLSGLPIDSTSEILAHYPAMKLGVRESVRICAAHLGIAAQRIINRVSPVGPWTIASPPRFILPGAANLMARDIHRHLPAYARNAALLLEPRLTPAVVPSDVTGSTRLYSQAHFDDRLQERKRLHERLPPLDPARCRGRHVLFINDINVTGSQQHFMRKAFEAAGAAGIRRSARHIRRSNTNSITQDSHPSMNSRRSCRAKESTSPRGASIGCSTTMRHNCGRSFVR